MGFLIELLFELVFEIPALRMIVWAVVPALLLLMYVRKHDRLEPESPRLIWTLVGFGALSVIAAMVLESAGIYILSLIVSQRSILFQILHWFVVVGIAEEFSKYLFLKFKTWRNPEFNCSYDGLIYAVAVSAGFALAENITYVLRYGGSVVFIRGIVSIPAHICFSVFMGTWYTAAKKAELAGNMQQAKYASALAVAVPALAHGAFDFIAVNTGSAAMIAVFVVYVIVMFAVCWKRIKKLAEEDAYLVSAKPGGLDWGPGSSRDQDNGR